MAALKDPLSALFRIEGKVAVASDNGACSSLDVAPLFAAAGAVVVIADRDPEATRALAAQIDPAAERVVAIPTDIEDEAAVVALFRQVRERFGGLDILVNCAGVMANAPITDIPMSAYDDTQSLNQRATFMLMREGVRLMLETGRGGRIVNITTIGSVHPVLRGNAAYGASRAAVTAMTRAVALDPASAPARYGLGVTLLGVGRVSEAVGELWQTVRLPGAPCR